MGKIIKTNKGTYYINGNKVYKGVVGSYNENAARYDKGKSVGYESVPNNVRKIFKNQGVVVMDKETFDKQHPIKRTNNSKQVTRTYTITPKSKSKVNSNNSSNVNFGLNSTSTVKPNSTSTQTTKRSDLSTSKASIADKTRNTTKAIRTTKKNNINNTITPKSKSKINSNSRISSSTPDGNYTVNKGDSLWRIAKNNGMTLNELMEANPQIKNVNQVIHPGDKINVNGKGNTYKKITPRPDSQGRNMDLTLNTTVSEDQLTPPKRIPTTVSKSQEETTDMSNVQPVNQSSNETTNKPRYKYKKKPMLV